MAGLLIILIIIFLIDSHDKEKRRKTYEDFKKFCVAIKPDGHLEFKRACNAKEEIIAQIKSGEKLYDICVKNDIDVKYSIEIINNIDIEHDPWVKEKINAVAVLVARKMMEQDGYLPCLDTTFPIDKNFFHIDEMIEDKESFAKTMRMLAYKGYGKK